jgi:protein O-mannosyl-transferase
MDRGVPHRHGWWRPALIVVAGLLVYGNSLAGPFVFDDWAAVVTNDQIRSVWHAGSVFFPARELPTAGRPLVNLSFALNYAVGALNVRGYHAVNIAVHIGCALLLFGVVGRLLESPRIRAVFAGRSQDLAFAAALLWLVHPLNSEAVDYITQRTESMMALFYLLAVYASVRAVGEHRWRWTSIAVLSSALGMVCKESMVTAPFIIMLCDRTILFESWTAAWKHRWRLYGGLAATEGIVAAIVWAGPRSYTAGFSAGVHSWDYLLNQTVMITRYLRLSAWPTSLVIAYGLPRTLSLADVMPEAAFIVGLLIVMGVTLVRWPALGFPVAAFFVLLAPTSSVLPIATEVGAERRMYLPLAALITLVVVGIALLQDGWQRQASLRRALSPRRVTLGGWILLAFASVACGARTMQRNREYASALTLARATVDRWPSPAAHKMLGVELSSAGHHAEAVTEFRRAAGTFPTGRFHLAVELQALGESDQALDQFQRFVDEQEQHQRDTGQRQVAEVGPAYIALSRILMARHRWKDAILSLRTLRELSPSNAEAGGLLSEAMVESGIELATTGRSSEALSEFQLAAAVDPQNSAAQSNLAVALVKYGGSLDDALAHARLAVALNGSDPATLDLLGRVLATRGEADAARTQFERALQIDPNNREAREYVSHSLSR